MIAASILSRLPNIAKQIRTHRVYFFVAGAIAATYLLFGWLALPGILQSQAESYVLARSGHHLTMDRPSFNPFLLRLHLKNLRLTEPDGRPLVAFKSLVIDFSSTSLFRRAYVFDEIALDGLNASVIVLPGDKLNWSRFIEAFQSKEKTSSEMPRLVIRKFSLTGARLYLADRRGAAERSTRLAPINLALTDLSTLPKDRGQYRLTATTNFGARFVWDGDISLKPIAVAGHVRIDNVSLPKLAPYLTLPATITAPQGVASFSTAYRAGMVDERFNLRLDALTLHLAGFKIAGKSDPSASLAFDSVDMKGGRLDLHDRSVVLGSIALNGGGLSAARDAKGKINILALMPAQKKTQEAAPPSHNAAEWHYRIGKLRLAGFGVDFRDGTVGPAAQVALRAIAADVSDISDDMSRPLPIRLSAQSQAGGTFAAEGTVVPATSTTDVQVKVDGLALTPIQPYIAHVTTLKLVSGAVSGKGHATYDGKAATYTGSAAVRDLRIIETGSRQTFLAWKSLSTTTLNASTSQLAVRELVLDGLDTKVMIAKDKSINLTKVLRQQPRTASAPASAQTSATFPVRIARIRILRSQLDFADQSLALPFGTHIHALSGTLVNISSKPGGAPARLLIGGQIDDYGMAHAEGRLNLFKPTDLLDIKVDFNNVEMTRLTPYSATFAGRRIASGKLTLNLEYKIVNRQLTGDNRIIMDQLTLGERVESPQAHDLPLDLAIAILEDSDGRIDLGLPVSGSLDDPQFSYRQIIWKAVVNVLTKIVTSPFRALGALFGGDDKFDGLSFAAGDGTLSPPEREKLAAFAGSLAKHPKLAVTIHGTWSEADRVALQDLALRRQIAGKLGLSTEGDPGLLTPDQPKVKAALEELYASRFGNGALAALREGFGKANPGKLETSTTGQMMSVLTGLIGTKPELSQTDIAQMKGADYPALLYQKLQAAEDITDADMQKLAQARALAVMNGLRAAQAPMDRLKLDTVEKTDAQDKAVPLKMDMAPVAATAPSN